MRELWEPYLARLDGRKAVPSCVILGHRLNQRNNTSGNCLISSSALLSHPGNNGLKPCFKVVLLVRT